MTPRQSALSWTRRVLGGLGLVIALGTLSPVALTRAASFRGDGDDLTRLDRTLRQVLRDAGFTGRIERTLEARLGRPLDPALADLGRLLFFDKILGLHDDNSCAGCHSPAFGFGDSQPMAIGVDNNDVVGPNRRGPRNQRRSPLVANTIFYPALMWTPRFVALSGDPFDASRGFQFPPPGERRNRRADAAGGAGIAALDRAGRDGRVHRDHGQPGPLRPAPLSVRRRPRRGAARHRRDRLSQLPDPGRGHARLNAMPGYLEKFGTGVQRRQRHCRPGGSRISMRRLAIAEFQTMLTAANAPLDRFARGEADAMTPGQKRGALLFFGKANCVACHAVAGASNEMFSDFQPHRIGGPQVAPGLWRRHRQRRSSTGPARTRISASSRPRGIQSLRYTFRTAPLRNLKVAPAFFHNGAFGTLEAAIAHHLDVEASLRRYDPAANRPAGGPDAPGRSRGSSRPASTRCCAGRAGSSAQEFHDLVEFVRDGLFDDAGARLLRAPPAVGAERHAAATLRGVSASRSPGRRIA